MAGVGPGSVGLLVQGGSSREYTVGSSLVEEMTPETAQEDHGL